MTDSKTHWEGIYNAKAADKVSWFQTHPTHSLPLIQRAAASHAARILDVGSGASTLLGALIDAGYQNICAIDISSAALAVAQRQLDGRANQVEWVEADVTRLQLPPQSVDVWHDRAVFHFLTRTSDR